MVRKRFDNLPEKMTAHAVRRLIRCDHCAGFGDRTLMILITDAQDYGKILHTKCFAERLGMAKVLELPREEKGKFRLCDLSVRDMQRLLRTM